MIAGNGGSAADSDHITGELTKSFLFKRRIDPAVDSYLRSTYGEEGANLALNLEGGLPCIPLTTFNASNSAFSNDVEPKVMFAQLVNALGKKGDCNRRWNLRLDQCCLPWLSIFCRWDSPYPR